MPAHAGPWHGACNSSNGVPWRKLATPCDDAEGARSSEMGTRTPGCEGRKELALFTAFPIKQTDVTATPSLPAFGFTLVAPPLISQLELIRLLTRR